MTAPVIHPSDTAETNGARRTGPSLPVITVAALLAAISLPACRQITTPEPARGVVRFHTDIPSDCQTTSGIKQTVVRRVNSEADLRKHYGLTFKVHFNDGVSPVLYGTLYYQNRDRNFYCMALPDGRFATFEDSQVTEHRRNVMQEICFPIQDCSKD